MRPHNLHQLGDEPLYCEAQHDGDSVLSGSDDDYYEAPEHRHIRIEAKALQFLNGEVPYLLSARLRGPFDTKSWKNPWKSTRAQRQPAHRRASRTSRSQTRVEATGLRGSGQLGDDLPDTQGTSLYPLPSPEATNPPSARKNSFMDEDEYSRIKEWREAVKSVPLSRDPFWAPGRDRDQGTSKTSKRPADRELIHGRPSKRRKPALPAMSPEESPSQKASRARRILTSQNSGLTTQSAPDPFTCENELDELAAPKVTQVSSFDASRLAYGTTGTPVSSRPVRGSPSSRWRLHYLDPDLSEDELSLPSTTPSRKVSQPSVKMGRGSTHRSPKSKQKPTGRTLSSSIHEDTTGGKTREERGTNSQPSTPGQRLDLRRSKRLSKDATRTAMVSSQQDASFHFHHARPRSPAQQPKEQHPRMGEMDAADVNQPILCVQAAASHLDDEPLTGTYDRQVAVPEEAGHSEVVADEAIDEALAGRVPEVMADDPAVEGQGMEDPQAVRQQTVGTDEICIRPKAEEPTFVCTQELSPISICGKNAQASTWPSTTIEATAPQSNPRNTCGCSDSECSTSDHLQDLSTKSIKTLSARSDAENTSEREWSTYIDTQDLSAVPEQSPSNRTASDKVEVVSQGPDDINDPDWTTFINTQDLTITSALGCEDHKLEQSGAVEPNSEWSTYMSVSFQTDAEEMGDTTLGPGLGEPAVTPAPKPSETNVRDTIVVYTNQKTPDEEPVEEGKRHDLAEIQVMDTIPMTCDEEAAQPDAGSWEKHDAVSAEHLTNVLPSSSVSILQAGRSNQAMPQSQEADDSSLVNLDGTTASLEPMKSQSPWGKETSSFLQDPMHQLNDVDTTLQKAPADATSTSGEPQPLQSPWQIDGDPVLGTITAPLGVLAALDGPALGIESQEPPSLWAETNKDMPWSDAPENHSNLNESSSNLSVLAGKALAFSAAPQTPWLGDKLPSPDFSLSVKRFSDFMELSPIKTRAPARASILRRSASCSRVLFKAPTAPRAERRVTFAPLPGEKSSPGGVASKDGSEICVGEDVSYFDSNGNRTASIRVTRPTSRAVSPPPSNINITETDELPDHDHKFSKHFAVMSKRKKQPPRRTPRLLPSDSQQTSGSQEVAAMAEAFIDASQTRRGIPDLVETPSRNIVQQIGSPAGKNSYAMGPSLFGGQENIEPTDDVSAVLDNIDDFLDNTWGVNTSMDVDTDEKDQAQPQSQAAEGCFNNVGDPMLAMSINVWAD